MTATIDRSLRPVALCALGLLTVLLLGSSAWAGPHLHRRIEYSKAKSQPQCEGLVRKVMATLASQGHFKVESSNPQLGAAPATTLYVDCISVGSNKMIYYISAASTNLHESKQLRSLVATRLAGITPID